MPLSVSPSVTTFSVKLVSSSRPVISRILSLFFGILFIEEVVLHLLMFPKPSAIHPHHDFHINLRYPRSRCSSHLSEISPLHSNRRTVHEICRVDFCSLCGCHGKYAGLSTAPVCPFSQKRDVNQRSVGMLPPSG